MSDATILLRDIAGDAAQKAANQVNPSDEQLSQIDHAAEDNTWHEAPNFGEMKGNLQSKVPFGKKEAKETVGDVTQAAHPSGTRDPATAADATAQAGTTNVVDPNAGAATGVQSAKDKISANTSEDQKQKAREYRERTREYFKGKVPKDRREQVIYRLKKMIVEVQGHEDCKKLTHSS